MRIFSVILGLSFLGISQASLAQNSIVYDVPPDVGHSTKQWLKLQREGEKASKTPQPLSGPVAANVYERYKESFSHPIPEYFTTSEGDAAVLGQ